MNSQTGRDVFERPILQTWFMAFVKPSEKKYSEITKDKKATLKVGVLFILLAISIATLFSNLYYYLLYLSGRITASMFIGQISLFGGNPENDKSIIASLFFWTGVLIVVGLATSVLDILFTNWLANLFGGKGSLDSLGYLYGACSAAYALIGIIFNVIPDPFHTIFVLLLLVYQFFVLVFVVKTVKNLSWLKAIFVRVIPVGIIFLLVFSYSIISILSI